MAKVTGIPAPARGRYWVKCLDGRVQPANEEAARALTAQGLTSWPVAFELHTSGSRLAVPNAAMADGVSDGDFIDIPATPYGAGVIIGPAVIITGTLVDNMGQQRRISRRGVIAEDSAGEWNINSPMTGDAFPTGNNTGGGAPAGALTTNDLGVVVPSQAAFAALAGDVGGNNGPSQLLRANGDGVLAFGDAVLSYGLSGRDQGSRPDSYALGYTVVYDMTSVPSALSAANTVITFNGGYYHPGATYQMLTDNRGAVAWRGAANPGVWGAWRLAQPFVWGGLGEVGANTAPQAYAPGETRLIDPPGAPEANGTLITQASGYFHPGATFQLFYGISGATYTRGATAATTWAAWRQIVPGY